MPPTHCGHFPWAIHTQVASYSSGAPAGSMVPIAFYNTLECKGTMQMQQVGFLSLIILCFNPIPQWFQLPLYPPQLQLPLPQHQAPARWKLTLITRAQILVLLRTRPTWKTAESTAGAMLPTRHTSVTRLTAKNANVKRALRAGVHLQDLYLERSTVT